MNEQEILVTGAKGQLGQALQEQFPGAVFTDKDTLDITSPSDLEDFEWGRVRTIINAAAYTNVDGAETPEGKELAWKINHLAVRNLAKLALEHDINLVHISSDYVFDGKKTTPYSESDQPNPISEYGKSKLAGDVEVTKVPKNYLLRTSWVVGEGKNFVNTMLSLGRNGVEPQVVCDQVGRPTFTSELAMGIKHLLESDAEYGLYNLTNEGTPVTWSDLTREIYKQAGYNLKVGDISTAKYFADKPNAAPRPANSVLSLDKILATGFRPNNWQDDLGRYIKKEQAK